MNSRMKDLGYSFLTMSAVSALIAVGTPSPLLANDQSVASAPAATATPKKSQHYGPESDAKFKATVAGIDKAMVAAWRAGNMTKLEAMIDPEFTGVDAFGGPHKQMMNKDQFLDYLKKTPPAANVQVVDPSVRLMAWMSDVAVVNGTLKDSTKPDDSGHIYTAIYVRLLDDWQMLRFIVSPLAMVPFPKDEPAAADWSPEAFSVTQMKAINVVRDWFDQQARRDYDSMEKKTLGAKFWQIHPNVPAGASRSKEAYLAMKRGRPVAPELVGLDKPDVQFFGNYGDLAIVTGIRRDATGGAVFGSSFKPQWRSVVYYIAVVQRENLFSENWYLQHYHAAYVNPETLKTPAP